MLTRNFWKVFASLYAGLSKSIELKRVNGSVDDETVFNNNAPSASAVSILTTIGATNYAPTLRNIITSGDSKGTAFGDGTDEPTLDDYTLSGNFIRTITGTASASSKVDDDGVEITSLFTLTNTGTDPITISEVGRFGGFKGYLVERVLLEVPVTIPAGGVGQVTFTTRFDFPW